MTDLSNTSRRDTLTRAMQAIERLEAKLKTTQAQQNEPLAVVGMACRFPGSVDSLEAYWNLLQEGRTTVDRIPTDRWDADAWYDPDPDTPGKSITRYGNFITSRSPYAFDAGLFRITPREAARLDPQQRLLLETTWQALEYAAIAPESLRSSQTGVFIAQGTYDFMGVGFRDILDVDAFSNSGVAPSAASGRISYAFGLNGPSYTIDTACSSGMVALHFAGQHLRTGDCDVALVGGANLMLTAPAMVAFSKSRVLSPDGFTRSFSTNAAGYGRSEGCGMLVLKRLSDAQRDGDTVLATVLGSAVNHNGRSSGIMAPLPGAQSDVMRAALQSANVEPETVSYLEAHGTGTPVGDAVELDAIAEVYGSAPREHPLRIGSVKANIGHLEGASAISALIKVVLMLQHGEIPPYPLADDLTDMLDWDTLPLRVDRESRSWPTTDRRIAAVSSFGFSGTNAHMILAAVDTQRAQSHGQDQHDAPRLLTISGQAIAALRQNVSAYVNLLSAQPDIDLADLCYTSQVGRNHLPVRAAFVAHTGKEMLDALNSWLDDDQQVLASPSRQHPVAFHFSGDLVEQHRTAQRLIDLGMRPAVLLAEGTGLRTAALLAGALDESGTHAVSQPNFPILLPGTDAPLSLEQLQETLRLRKVIRGGQYILDGAIKTVVSFGDAPSLPEDVCDVDFRDSSSRAWLQGLAALYESGVTPDWSELQPGNVQSKRLIGLPSYAFQRNEYRLRSSSKSAQLPTPSALEEEVTVSDEITDTLDLNLDAFLQMSEPEQTAVIKQLLIDAICEITGLTPETLDLSATFTELGMESLMLLRLISRVSKVLRFRLTTMFDMVADTPIEIFIPEIVRNSVAYHTAISQIEAASSEAGDQRQVSAPVPPPPAHRVNTKFATKASTTIPELVFLLSAPRSGSTLARAILNTHREIFAPPEMYLMLFDDMQTYVNLLRKEGLEDNLIKAVMDADKLPQQDASTIVYDWIDQNKPTAEVYSYLLEHSGASTIVDKTPMYAYSLDAMKRIPHLYPDAKVIFLSRHPYTAIDSQLRIRLFNTFVNPFVDNSFPPNMFRKAEEHWSMLNRNILDFCTGFDPDMWMHLRFEDLVTQPEAYCRQLCDFIGLSYDPAMLHPYDIDQHTDRFASHRPRGGDPHFNNYTDIDSSKGTAWQTLRLPDPLGWGARTLATELGYELPKERELGLVEAKAQAPAAVEKPGLRSELGPDQIYARLRHGHKTANLESGQFSYRMVNKARTYVRKNAHRIPIKRGLKYIRWLVGNPLVRIIGYQKLHNVRNALHTITGEAPDAKLMNAWLFHMASQRLGWYAMKPRAMSQKARYLTVHGYDYVTQAQKQGKGVIMLGSHIHPLYGWPECIAPYLRLRGVGPLKGIGRLRHHVGMTRKEVYQGSTPEKQQIIQKQLLSFTETLDQNGITYVAIDGLTGWSTRVSVPFFDTEIPVMPGFSEIALATGATVIPANVAVDLEGNFDLIFDAPLPVPMADLSHEQRLRLLLGAGFASLENFLRKHPELTPMRIVHLLNSGKWKSD